MASQRLDLLLVERGLAASRDRAQRLIRAGQVLVDEQIVDKPGTRIKLEATLRTKVPDHPYVGRGGLKLQYGLEDLGLDVAGLRCLDVGASTGGFTDCLLQRGAREVVAVDVGTNQLAWKLRQDPRVLVHEQTDARDLTPELLAGPIDLVVVDASFISLRLLLPAIHGAVAPGTRLMMLVKPQFEVGREHIGKGGKVRDPTQRALAIDHAAVTATELGFDELGRCDSRLPGARAGNLEAFVLLSRRG